MKKSLLSLLLFISFLAAAQACWAGVSIQGELSQRTSASPGERYEGTIVLKNSDSSPNAVRISQNDYIFFANGRNDYGTPGTLPRSNAKWLTVSPSQLVVPPNGTASIHYIVQVPKIAELSGSYWSIIMVEPQAAPEQKSSVLTQIRYAVQVVTDTGESGEHKIKFLDRQLISKDGKKTLLLDIENEGERWLSPVLWVDLYNDTGQNVGHFESAQQRIYPGCSVRHRLDLSEVPSGKYTALTIVDNRDDNVFGGQYELVIK